MVTLTVPASIDIPSQFPTLAECYRALADELGLYCRSIVSSATVTGEPGRWALVDALRDDEEDRSQYAGGYIHAVNGTYAGQDRRIRREGYEGHYGALQLARPYPATLAPGTDVEVTYPLPVRRVGTMRGLVDFIRDATERVYVEARIPLVGNGTRLYSLDGYDFITSEEWTNGIYDWCGQSSTITPARPVTWSPNVKVNGPTITLELPIVYGIDVPFELGVFVLANRLIYDGSAWGYSSAGLVADTDQVAAPMRWIRPIAMLKALQYLTMRAESDETLSDAQRARLLAQYGRRLATWAVAAAKIIADELPRPAALNMDAMTNATECRSSLYPWEGPTSLPVSSTV